MRQQVTRSDLTEVGNQILPSLPMVIVIMRTHPSKGRSGTKVCGLHSPIYKDSSPPSRHTWAPVNPREGHTSKSYMGSSACCIICMHEKNAPLACRVLSWKKKTKNEKLGRYVRVVYSSITPFLQENSWLNIVLSALCFCYILNIFRGDAEVNAASKKKQRIIQGKSISPVCF